MTMSSKDVQDRRTVVWLGEIPPGKENEMRYPTEEEVELSLYVMENLSEEEYNEFEREAKRIVRKKLQSQL